ncbi:transposase [Acidocella aminolytica 101 = DSM 11237]|uniref:Transposase n=1 Tax=Acidocella aminolytica 101 = DSM 11237 TaxID=1120923 RepID=A0A0D6PI35_9PROT|nr:transposase [Acidocella aminolytica 101 = DSM 11237]GBQ32417.1 hypothetical protein AA11237_0152 [Acidocella aminolytica 101 = DSM 11237]
MTGKTNLTALAELSGQWIDAVHAHRPTNTVVLDMDSSVSPTHGEQEGTAYNGEQDMFLLRFGQSRTGAVTADFQMRRLWI